MTDRSVIVNNGRYGPIVAVPPCRVTVGSAKQSSLDEAEQKIGLLRRSAARDDESPAMKFQRSTGSSITSRSDGLDAGLGDDVTPFRHFVVDALSHALGSVGDDFEAIVAQLLRDDRHLQNFDGLGR